jgi:para-nitrobenzyl esterase
MPASSRRASIPALRLGITAALMAALSACSSLGGAVDAPASGAVATRSGPVQSVERDGMRTWFAIPFAAPPVGDLRWRAPQPAKAWTQPIAATKSASSCLQPGDSPFSVGGQSEDCLYLDVHAPGLTRAKSALPVMVWIHGGAFTTVSASVYADPRPLVSNGVIVVSINYRLGPMGFLGHPALKAADGSVGNYGMMDQQAALRWVKDNIAAFGGDPRNVTIFGESAGGFSVMTHLASPTSAGLFQKAIIQSGAYGVGTQLTRDQLETRSTQVATRALEAAARAGVALPCAADAITADCLRALPEGVLKTQLPAAFAAGGYNPVPSVDGVVLTETIRDAFAAGRNNRVPVINGSNEDEYHLFLALQEMGARMRASPPNLDPADKRFLLAPPAFAMAAGAVSAGTGIAPADIVKSYVLSEFGSDPAFQPTLAASAAATALIFSCNGLNVSKRIEAQGSPVWTYEFRDQTAPPLVGRVDGKYPMSLRMGAAHASELQYLFNMQPLESAEQTALSRTMATYWTNFARKGDPNGDGAPKWTGAKSSTIQALDVASGGGVKPMPAADFVKQHKCDTAWAGLKF